MHRRLAISAAVAMAFVLTGRADALDHERGYGEPYAVAGKRIVFTTWYWVRPGKLDWRDKNGESVFAQSERKLGPADVTFHYDDYPHGIELVAEQAERVGPVIAREKPWEAMGITPRTILHEDGRYRLWALCQDTHGDSFGCYYESVDGMHWRRPELGLIEHDGSKANNLLPESFPGSVFRDPVAPADERYKMVWHGDYEMDQFNNDYKARRPYSQMALETDVGRVHSIRAAVSPDGLRWTVLPEPVSVEPSDTDIVACYDEGLKKYVMYTRSYMVGPRADGFPVDIQQRRHQFTPRRAIGRSESVDFRAFPLSEVIVEPGNDMKPTDVYYTNCRTTIPRAPDHHLMFPAVYHLADDTTSIELQTSCDGKVWHKAPGGYVLETGTDGQWDGGCVFARANLVELPNGDWVLPYAGYLYPHKFPRGAWSYDVGYMRWSKGRLMAMEAKGDGEFATVAFVAPGRRLRLNAVTLRAGYVQVAACDFNGEPLSGRGYTDATPLSGDLFRAPVTWGDKLDLGVDPGQPVMLRFRMKMAKLYGIEFE